MRDRRDGLIKTAVYQLANAILDVNQATEREVEELNRAVRDWQMKIAKRWERDEKRRKAMPDDGGPFF